MDRLGGITVEDSDGDTELPPDGVNSVPRHPPRFPHQQMHGDRLPWIETDPVSDDFEGGGPL